MISFYPWWDLQFMQEHRELSGCGAGGDYCKFQGYGAGGANQYRGCGAGGDYCKFQRYGAGGANQYKNKIPYICK